MTRFVSPAERGTRHGEGIRRGVGSPWGSRTSATRRDSTTTARHAFGSADGSAEVHCASAEVGQGVTDVILQVARLELGTEDVAWRRVRPPRSAPQARRLPRG